ncbi:putative alpha-1,2-mannosidase [Dinghuibacter silviterrae]|uniref:Putative alpha-1,2-mannosidase n=1 Tax=Dinghuibacter silviterrae TaxID=1539049 RepID=A0A4R8DIE3_9BACT|nr:putative alpha-1,2-mannosidase [Dinghuibacter silviterrae]
MLALAPLALHAQMQHPLLPYVNPLIGTAPSATKATLAHGQGTEALANTIPSVTYPFGMTQWVAQTRFSETKCVAPYYYGDSLFSGFRGSHWISGSCMQDYGSVTVTAITGTLRLDDPGTAFTHAAETATPAYYRVDLPQRGLRAEVTATARCGFIRFTALRDDSVYILIHPNSDRGLATLQVDGNLVSGRNPVYRLYQGGGQPAGFDGCFAVRFPGVTSSVKIVPVAGGVVAYVGFWEKAGQTIQLKIGTSFTSEAGAARNLTAEIPGWNFDAVVSAARRVWEQELSRVTLEVMADSVRRIFYTAMYHAMQQPRLYSDVDGTYPMFATSYKNARLAHAMAARRTAAAPPAVGGAYYDDFSMWDIYRAQIPLIEILRPALAGDLVHSILLKAEQGGWLPDFPCWNNYTAEMVGNHANALIASAAARGIPVDLETAYRYMRKDAFDIPDAAAYKDGRGRRSLASYLALGYYPLEDEVSEAFHKNEQTSRTLEYAYDDYCIAQIAKTLKKQQDYDTLMARSRNYVHVFDKRTGFMNGRHADGSFYPLKDPDARLYFVTEGTPRQYTFYVPQDMPGLTGLLGGPEKLEAALDSLFDKGQYWHGNEPDQQTPFLYNYTDHPYRSSQRVHTILEEEYANRPGGLCGNDDEGEISAWYVLGALGLYPVDPASGDYAVCLPLVRAATLHLPGGKTFRIIVRTAGPQYTLVLNGQPHPSFSLSHAELQKGGVLEFR